MKRSSKHSPKYERRYLPRKTTAKSIIKIKPNSKSAKDQDALEGKLKNINEMGLLCELSQSLDKNKNVIIYLTLPTSNNEIRIIGEVVWRDDKKYIYGIEFTQYSDDQITPIFYFVNQNKDTQPDDRRGKSRRSSDSLESEKASQMSFLFRKIRDQLDNRVVVTGIGVISPFGTGTDVFIEGLRNGKSAVRSIKNFDTTNYRCKLAGQVLDFDPLDFMNNKKSKLIDRSTQFAISASTMALSDSKLKIRKNYLPTDIAVFIGTTTSGHYHYYKQLQRFLSKGPNSVSPFAPISCFPDACSGQVSIHFRLRGPSMTINTGCASGTSAITQAYNALKKGEIKAAIAGGTDTPVFEPIFAGFSQSKVLSQDNSTPAKTPKPFDKNRDGIILSEGAGIVILETLDNALKRDAKIYGEITGFGNTCDAYRMVGPEPSGRERERAINIALENSNTQVEEVNYINAHGTGTKTNDKIETQIIKRVFGNWAKKIPVSSTKSMIGHTQGACGAIEIIASLATIDQNLIFPTINLSRPDSDCDLDYVPNQARHANVDVCLSNSFAFGGKNETVVLKKFKN